MTLFSTSMFIAAIENFVLLSTVLALGTFVVALIVRRLSVNQIWRPRSETLARLYTAALVAPPLASLWLVIAALLPKIWMTPEAFASQHAAPLHEIHLLGALTLAVEPALAYGILLFVIVIGAAVIWSNLRGSWRVDRVIKQLNMNACPPPPAQIELVNEAARRAGFSVGLVMSDYALSFVWGFRRSKLILSSGLLNTLTAVELKGVLEHEAAHHERRDNLVKLLLSVCSYSSLAFPLTRAIVSWRATEVEMICDGVAARRTSEPLEIAEALVKLRRQTLARGVTAEPVATSIASSFVSDSAVMFERRVDRLLAFEDSGSPHQNTSFATRFSVVLLAASVITLSAILLFAPLSVHHATESLIEIIK